MPTSIIFVDSHVANYQSLIDSFSEPAEVFVLDGASGGLAQMAAYLQGRTGIDAIHVISHGSQGALYLGSSVFDSSNLASYQSQLASIGGALTETGDILLYGCNVAQGNVGVQFINSLAQYTGGDVAASSDATGAAVLGGDWVLEDATGIVDVAPQQVGEMTELLVANTAPSFIVGTGIVRTDFGANDVAYSVAAQSDGKILVAGSSGSGIALVRYNVDGSLDTSFDNDGKLITEFGGTSGTSSDIGNDIAVQADGKILVAGTTDSFDFAVARYNVDGSLDTSFGTDGKVTTDFSYHSMEYGESITLQTDGKIVVAGYEKSYSNSKAIFALARYNANGSLDTGFGVNGKVLGNEDSQSNKVINSVIMQTDGKILAAGSLGNYAFDVARYNANGSLDTSFFANGELVIYPPNYQNAFGQDIALQADGKMLVAGYSTGGPYYDGSASHYDFTLVRYHANGNIDTGFGTNGWVVTDLGWNNSDIVNSCSIQSDGKIVVVGSTLKPAAVGGRYDFAVVRYNANGSLDSTFGLNGKITTNVGTGSGYTSWNPVGSGVIQADGKILVAGTSGGDFVLVRYNLDGSLDGTFSPPANTLNGSPTFREGSNSVNLASNAQILDTGLSIANSYNGATLTIFRHGGASAEDVFSAKAISSTTLNEPVLQVLGIGNNLVMDFVAIGLVTTNNAGILTLTFNTNATQSLVNSAMQQIAYANTSDAPPSSVQIDWTFNDGNTGAQGTGGSMSVTGSTTVQITAVNDAPILSVPLVDQTLTSSTAFSYTVPASAFTDPDLGTLTYSVIMADGASVPAWLTFNASTRTFSGTPGTSDVGAFDIRVTAKDSVSASASDVVRLTVTAPDTAAPIASTFNPLDESTDIAIYSNIVLTFNEAIARGAGNIVLKTAAGVTVATYDAASSTNLAVAGNTLTINPTSDLTNGTSYKVEFAAGTIKDLAGNSYAGTSSYNFTTANGVPVATSATVSAVEDTAKTGTLTGTDPEGSTLTFAKVADPSHGTLTINASTGAYVYTPASNYNGADGFLFTVNDGTVDSTVATMNIVVSAVNDLPTGTVTISGTATQGQILTAANNLADADGIGVISYQWQAAGVDILGATASVYTLNQTEVGKAITVKASYNDALGTPESKVSAPTSEVVTNQIFTGSTASESFTSGPGNDSIDGGGGTDTIAYSMSRSSFALTKTSTGFTVADNTGTNGTDTLLNVERIKFSDGAVALDVGATQPAGQTALLMGSVLPGRLVFDTSKQPLLGAVIDLFDQGYSLQTLSGAVMRLPIWDILTGKATPSNTDIASYLLTNVNGVAPDATTLATAVAALDTETSFATQGNFLWHLAESSTNQTHVGLVGLAATGLAYGW